MFSISTYGEKLSYLIKNQDVRNRLISLAQSIIGVISYLIVMRYVVQVAGLEGVGIWSMTVGFVSFIRLVDLSGASGLGRMLATRLDDPSEQARYVDTMSLFILLLYGVLCGASYLPLTYLLSDSVPPSQWPLTQILLIWALFSLPLNVLGLAQLSAIDGIGRADIRSLINILGFGIFFTIAISLIEKEGLLGLAYAQFAQFIVTLIAARLVLVKRIMDVKLVPIQVSRGAAKACLYYGIRLQLVSLPMAFCDPLTRVLVGRWAGLEALGVYDLCYKLAGNTRTLIQAYLTPLVPQFASLWIHDREAARILFKSTNEPARRVVVAAFGVLILLSPFASLFFLSEVSSVFMISTAILASAWGLATLALPTHLLARAAGMFRWSIIGQFLILVLVPPLIYWTAHQAGQVWVAVGVAAAVVIGHSVTFLGETKMLGMTSINNKKECTNFITMTAIIVLIIISFIFIALSAAKVQF